MNLQIAPAPVRKSLLVKALPARAFDIFTAGMSRWWRPDHHLGKSPLKDVVMEPRTGGRWYEVCVDGSECTWGKVLLWNPPERLILAWQLDADWKYDPDFVTEVELRFRPEGTGTRIDFEHRNLDRYAERAEKIRADLDSNEGWGAALADFGRVADGG